VASLVPADVETPLPAGAEPALATVGSNAVSATAATVAMTAARPIYENKPLRANISMSSVG
jgi:hypothetical protein